jgi:hypothetical protein
MNAVTWCWLLCGNTLCVHHSTCGISTAKATPDLQTEVVSLSPDTCLPCQFLYDKKGKWE